MNPTEMSVTDRDRLVLEQFPFPIAANFRTAVAATSWAIRGDLLFEIFEITLKLLTLTALSEYLNSDIQALQRESLNEFLYHSLPRASLGQWKRMLFDLVEAYQGHRELFFMTDLYDLVWDTSQQPHRRRRGVQDPYNRLIELRNAHAHQHQRPRTEPAWQECCGSILDDLREIFGQLSFLTQYDLLYVFPPSHDRAEAALFKGEHIRRETLSLPDGKTLQAGSLSWRRPDGRFLRLHPLLVLWHDVQVSAALEEGNGDAALFLALGKRSVTYLATVLQQRLQEDETFADFMHLYEQLDLPRPLTDEETGVTWAVLREIAAQMLTRNAGGLRSKFERDLCLPRMQPSAQFQAFLDSEANALLILGRSGVGKSTFLATLIDVCRSNEQLCVLFYDAASELLSADEESLAAAIVQDIQRYLPRDSRLGDANQPPGLAALVPALEQPDAAAAGRLRLVLFIDGLNESADAKGLLRKICALLESTPYPWLKLVLTSRPEAWRAMKRGVRVPENLFFAAGRAGDSFPALELQPFDGAELTAAYENYRRFYQLRTPYEELTPEMRRTLRDPLALKLVSTIYRAAAIPRTLHADDLCARFVEGLVSDGRLAVEDVRFLDHELLPLMIADGRYQNTVTRQQLEAASTPSGELLSDLVTNDDVLRSGRRVNQSFTNLADAEILQRSGSPLDYEVGFKYERFYDYYAGERLYDLIENAPQPLDVLLDLIRRTATQPYLWGPVRRAGRRLAETRGVSALLPLCDSDEPRVQEMAIALLADVADGNREPVLQLLDQLLPTEREPGLLGRLARLKGSKTAANDTMAVNPQRVAVAVAGALGTEPVLLRATTAHASAVAVQAVHRTYLVWGQDREVVLNVLDGIARKASASFVPDGRAIESLVGLSLLIYVDEFRDPIVVRRLRGAWRTVIDKFLIVSPAGGGLAKLAGGPIREVVFRTVTAVLFRLMEQFPQYVTFNYEDAARFFRLPREQKDLYSRVIGYAGAGEPIDTAARERDLRAATQVSDLFLDYAACGAMWAWEAADRATFLPFYERLLHEVEQDPASSWMYYQPSLLCLLLDKNPRDDAVWDLFLQAVNACAGYYSRIGRVPGYAQDRSNVSPEAMYFANYAAYQYLRTGDSKTDWVLDRVKRALQRDDRLFFAQLLGTELPMAGIEMRQPQAVLDILPYCYQQGNATADALSERLLSRMRTYFPDEVDDALEAMQVPQEARLRLRVNQPNERVGDLLGARTTNFVRDQMLLGPPAQRVALSRVFAAAAECRNVQEWAEGLLRQAINLGYGAEVLSAR